MNEYRLVVCEKPSVARSIAAVLGAGRREDGFLSGGGYLVSWCFGHLAELSDADAYDEKYGKWRREDLPILPDSWQYTVARDKQKQMNTLRALMHRDDVYEVVNACDAGREGELIFRTAYNLNNCRKRVKRLWISSMEDAAILHGFDNLRDGAEYDNLYASALCRARADWLVGINATRLFSVMYHRTLNVGRVVSPTLALLVQREAEINAFQPESFYTVHLDFGGFSAAGGRMKEQAEAERLAGDCNSKTAAVTSVVQTEKDGESPGALRPDHAPAGCEPLAWVHGAADAGLSAKSLRKEALHLPPHRQPLSHRRYGERRKRAGAVLRGRLRHRAARSRLFGAGVQQQKVSDHHAVVPTMAAGETDLETLLAGERELLRLAARQVLMAVSAPFVYLETEARLDCGGNAFAAKGKTILNMGWRAYTERASRTAPSRSFPRDRCFPFPPARSKRENDPAQTIHRGYASVGHGDGGQGGYAGSCGAARAGNPATRAAVIEKLVATGFAERRKAKKSVRLVPTEAGVSLITVLPEQLQSPLLTAEWEHRLKGDRVRRAGRRRVPRLSIRDMVAALVRDAAPVDGAEVLFPSGRPVVGKCPRCGAEVTESKTAISAKDGAASSGCGGTTASLPPRRSA